MKILILSRGVPTSHDPQEGNFELEQAKALKAEGHEVVIMAVDSRVRKYWRTPGIEKRIVGGIPTYKLFLFPTSIVRRLLSFKCGVNLEAAEAKWLYKKVVKREGEFDLIHAHFLTPIYYATKIKDVHGIPVVGTEHWSRVNTPTPPSNVQYMGKYAYPRLDKLISVSGPLKECIKNNFNVDSQVIHNLIDTSHLLPLKTNRSKDSFTIILVGSLVKRKGFDFFLNAFAKSALKGKNVTVKIIGGGPERNSLEAQIKDLGLNDNVKLLGQQPKPVIFKELNDANVFILPSRVENFAVSVLEGLANGLPVIATICGGIRECIHEDNGILVEVDNEPQMIEALNRMYDTYENYNYQAIQDEALKLYSPDSIAKQVSHLYVELNPNNKSIGQ